MHTDPVIAALRKQQRLHDAFVSAVDTDKSSAAAAAYNAAFDELLRTKPRTRGGAAALIRHCLTEDARFPTKAEGGDAVTLLHTLAKADMTRFQRLRPGPSSLRGGSAEVTPG